MAAKIPTIYLPDAADQKVLFDMLWTPTLRYLCEETKEEGWAQWEPSVNYCPWLHCDGIRLRARRDRDPHYLIMNSARHFVEYLNRLTVRPYV